MNKWYWTRNELDAEEPLNKECWNLDSDEELEEYIERGREEFRGEWFHYVSEIFE